MTTPRIEEMVEKLYKKDFVVFGEAGMVIDKKKLTLHFHQALTEARQAGIDEAVKVVKGKKRLQEYQHFDEETPLKDELYNQALDDTIKALQDKK